MNLTPKQWLEAMGMKQEEVPQLLILEGTWWQKQRNEMRLAYLENVRELDFPEMHWGTYKDIPVVFCCAYGGPRAVEPVHVFAQVGTPTVIQIGSCGGLQHEAKTGDIVLPDPAIIGEGASQYYGGGSASVGTPELIDTLQGFLRDEGFTTHRGMHLTCSALFAQPEGGIEGWRKQGFLSVDMETSAVFTAANHFGMKSASMVFVWDELLRGRTWLDKFPEDETKRQDDANRFIFEAALKLLD